MFGTPDTVQYLMLLAGAVLIVAESFIPGAHFIVLGVALFATGSVTALIPGSSLLVTVVTFIATAAATFLAYQRLNLFGEEIAATSDSDSLIGAEGTVMEPVTADSGKVHLPGQNGFTPEFQARTMKGPIQEGETVVVVDGGGGSIVTVEPVDEADE